MAVKLDHANARVARKAEEAEVSTCVAGIIEAFTNGLNIFKRLRERRRKRKSSQKDQKTPDATSSAEHQLSKSLRRGPNEVAESTSPEKERKKHSSSSSSRQRSSGPVVTRMSIKHASSNHPQLCVMRPKTTRKSTSSTNNSSAAKSSSTSSRSSSPLASPQPKKIQMASPEPKKLQMAPQLPLYVPVDPFELETSGAIRRTLGSGAPKTGGVKQHVDSFNDDPREPWPQEHLHRASTKSPPPKPKSKPTPKHVLEPTPKLPTFSPASHRSSTPTPSAPSKPPVPSKPDYLSPPPPLLAQAPATLHFRRRMEKATPSSYTFASDSTKMGEIPQRKWNLPFDYEEAERLNAEAALNGYPNAPIGADKAEKRKKRFGFMRRGDV
ncbi:hypothetical protein DDE82_001633 [Stemphylium lycopersici]|nr:hypothetical protein DDE82_001633 [Stemphylium lycopersici]